MEASTQEAQRLWAQIFSGAQSQTAHTVATQACKGLRELVNRALDEPIIDLTALRELLDCGECGGSGNAEQLLLLACRPTGMACSSGRKLQCAAWELIEWCCRVRLTTRSQMMQALLKSDVLQLALEAAVEGALNAGKQRQGQSTQQQQQQQQQQQGRSKVAPVSIEQAVEVLTSITAKQLPNPPWVEPMLHDLVGLLAVSQSRFVVTRLLLLFQAYCYNHCGPAALKQELPSLSATVKQRRLCGEGAECLTARVAAARLIGEAWVDRDSTTRRLLANHDLSDLAATAEATHCGLGKAFNVLFWCMQLADHPRLRNHVSRWLVPRLAAGICYEANQGNYDRAGMLVNRLPALQAARPDLMAALLDHGLLSAIACCLKLPPSGAVIRGMVMISAMNVLHTLADADPAVMAAVRANSAVASAFAAAAKEAHLLGLIQQASPEVLPSGDKIVRLSRIRVCAFEGCGRVEGSNRVFKACAACKERVARDPLSSEDMVSFYCGKECQVADRYAGHSYCILEAITKGSVTPTDRKRLLLCLGCPMNASKWHTITDLLVHMDLATVEGMDRMRDDPSRAATWISAGIGTQLAAFLAGLKQRPAVDGPTLEQGHVAVELQTCFRAVIVIKSLLAVLVAEETCHGVLPVRLELAMQLFRQMCVGSCEWLSVAFEYACAAGVPIDDDRMEMLEDVCSICSMMCKVLEELGEPGRGGEALGGGPWAIELSRHVAGAITEAMAQRLLLGLHCGVEYVSVFRPRASLFVLVMAVGRHPGDQIELRMRMARCKACRAACVLALKWGAKDGPDHVSHFGVRLLLCLTFSQAVAEVSCREGGTELLPALCELLLSSSIIDGEDIDGRHNRRLWLIQTLNMLAWFPHGKAVVAKGRWLLHLCSKHLDKVPPSERVQTLKTMFKCHERALMLACMRGDPYHPKLAAAAAKEQLAAEEEAEAAATAQGVTRASQGAAAAAGEPSCAACGAVGQLLRCSRCRKAFFCSAACQKAAWPSHKRTCIKA